MTDLERDPLMPARRALTSIVELSALLHGQAYAQSAHREMPGGDALVLLGPVASPEAWLNRVETLERLWLERGNPPLVFTDPPIWSDEPRRLVPNPDRPIIDADESHIVWQLWWWTEDWRDRLGKVTDLRPTIYSEVKFIAASLQWVYDNEPKWDDFVRDLRRAVASMEALLRAGERDERSWVACLDCRTDRNGNDVRVRLVRKVEQHCGAHDDWTCPRCKRNYGDDRAQNFKLALGQALMEASERHTMTEAK